MNVKVLLVGAPWAYALTLLVAFVPVIAFQRGGAWHLLLPLLAFVIVPLADNAFGITRWPWKPVEHGPLRARFFRIVPRLSGLITIALVVWASWAVSTKPMAGWEFALFALSVGLISAYLGIIPGHELMHRPGRSERRLGSLVMAMVCYSHFCIEHVWGHHRHVATHDDPATARAGESLYRFWPRTLLRSLQSAWRIEAGLLRQRGRAVISIHNRILLWHGFTLAFIVATGLAWGAKSVAFFLIQSMVAVLFLETVNYFQHYGLTRDLMPGGGHEPVAPVHSWNSSHVLSNLNFLNLGRHSDHHHQMARAYHKLRHDDAAPQLPHGYAAMFMLSLAPPLFRRVMNPRLEAWRRDRSAAPRPLPPSRGQP